MSDARLLLYHGSNALVVQYCFADQDVLDAGLVSVGADSMPQS